MAIRRKMTLVGDAGVGKTSIVNYRRDDPASVAPTVLFTTCEVTDSRFPYVLDIVDTAGQERYRSYLPLYLRDADVVLVVFDRAARSTFENVREWVRVVQATADPKIVLIANKCDLPAAVDEAEIQAAGEELAFAATFFTSALSGSGIDALFMWLFQALAPLDVPGEGAFAPIGPIEQDSKKPCEGDCQL